MLAVRFYDVVLWLHITAVITAFGALFAYPVFLAVNARAPLAERTGLHRAQIAFSQRVTGPAIVVVLLAGAYLASDSDSWSQPWVVGPLVLLFVIAGLGSTVLRQSEERLVAASQASDETGYATALAGARAWTLVTLALVVLTVFVMTVKPG